MISAAIVLGWLPVSTVVFIMVSVKRRIRESREPFRCPIREHVTSPVLRLEEQR